MNKRSLTLFVACLAVNYCFSQSTATSHQSRLWNWGITNELPVTIQLNGYPGDLEWGGGFGVWSQYRSLRIQSGIRFSFHHYTRLSPNWSSSGFLYNQDKLIPITLTYWVREKKRYSLGLFLQAHWRPKYEFRAYSDDYTGYISTRDPFKVVPIHQEARRPAGWGFAEGIHLVFGPNDPVTFDIQLGFQHSLIKQQVTSRIFAYSGSKYDYFDTVTFTTLPIHSLFLNFQANINISSL
jgi:hypothetical protein